MNWKKCPTQKKRLCAIYGPLQSFFSPHCIIVSHFCELKSKSLSICTSLQLKKSTCMKSFANMSFWTPRAPHFNSYNSFAIIQDTCFSFLFLPPPPPLSLSLFYIVFDLISIIYLEKKSFLFSFTVRQISATNVVHSHRMK